MTRHDAPHGQTSDADESVHRHLVDVFGRARGGTATPDRRTFLSRARVRRDQLRRRRRAWTVTVPVFAAALVLVAVVVVTTIHSGTVRSDVSTETADRSGPTMAGVDGSPAALTDFSGPGTSIAAGLEVQEGSRLVGTVFPASPSGRPDMIESSALVVFDGDFPDTWGAYVGAVDELGFEVDHSHCGQDMGGNYGPTCGLFGDRPDGARLTLEAIAPRPGHAEYPTAMFVTAAVPDPASEVTTTTMDEFWQRLADRPAPPTSDPVASARDAGMRSVDDVSVPGVGDPFAPGWMDPDVGLRVDEGTRVLVAPAPLNGGSMGWVTVVRVSGDVDAAFDAYLHRAPDGAPGPDETPRRTRITRDGVTAHIGSWSVAGGPKLHLTALAAGDDTSLMLVNVVND